jgi:hypothetical protein
MVKGKLLTLFSNSFNSKPLVVGIFNIDFRKLNECTESASWPILNIKQMFVRLGTHHRSSIFGVMKGFNLRLSSGSISYPLGYSRLLARSITILGYLLVQSPSYFRR